MADVTRSSAAWVVGRFAGLAAIALLQTYWFLQPVPVAARVLAAVLVVLSISRPVSGLLIFAGLAPLSTPIASLCGGGAWLGVQLLEQLTLGVGAGVLLRGGSIEGRTRIGAPALFMAVVAIASAVAMIPAAAAPVAGSLWDGVLLHQLSIRQTALGSPIWAPLFAALVIAECGVLGWAVERIVRREPQLAARLVLVALVGHAGVALLDLHAVIGWALRTEEALKALPQLLATARVSVQMDWNAGASALLLAGVAGLGLMGKPWARRAGVGLLLLIVGTGLWTTGSRIAIAMGIGATVWAIGSSAVGSAWRRRLIAAGVVIVVLGVGAWLVVSNPTGRSAPLPGSITLRLVMAKAGVQMFRGAPVFGIGITKFYDASAEYAGQYLTSVGWRPRENAHNNFVQVLAEQGLAGFIALLWWLAVILVDRTRTQFATPDPLRRALRLAIIACLGTWMTGHPLIVPEFAFVFWLYCGILAALTPAVPSTRPRWPLRLLVVAVLATVYFRASALRDVAYLEHLGRGVSALWQHDDSQRYREAGTSFTLFLPATGRPVSVPIRRAPGSPDPLLVEIIIRGRSVDRVPIQGDEWQTILVVVPSESRHFESVEFVVRSERPDSTTQPVLVRVGKAVAR